jgi:T-complex protein 1 subunit zeta
LIARTATAQDDIYGDGTSSIVLLTGELLAQAERYLAEGMHPGVIIEGLEVAKQEARKFLEKFVSDVKKKVKVDREVLLSVAKTSLRTKVHEELADKLATIVVDATDIISLKDQPLDLFMVELMHMVHRLDTDTKLVKGLVLDHGARHPDMRTDLKNCYILTCNVNLEYEKRYTICESFNFI